MGFTRNLLLAAVCVFYAVASPGQAHNTTFNPSRDGFNFANSFQNVVNLPAGVNVRTSGLCGGMAYTALDYFLAHKPIPRQDYLPAEGTPLQRYIYDRQMTSLTSNIDKWAEVIVNPLGARDSEFFNWGLQGSNGGRLEELRSFIDRGMPVPLGLKSDKGGDHQVLAIGYDMGRYRGDLGANEGDLKIFVYDSNHPNNIMTLVPDVPHKVYVYTNPDGNVWRTYFVDKNYHARIPPDLSAVTYPNDGLAHELILTFVTGEDDLRGGNDNVNLTINLLDGTQQHYNAINGRARWMSNTSMPARVVLSRPVATSQIRSLLISDTFTGGAGGDNWDMRSLEVRAIGGGGMSNIIKTAGFHRFTGNDKDLLIDINAPPPPAAGQVTQLVLEIRTGGDDLRGGNDNLNIEIRFADGHVQTDPNVNHAAKWDNNTTHTVTLSLNRPVPVSQITSVTLVTTFSGGMGGDNWNMDSLRITANGTGINRVIGTYGAFRFTGSARQLSVPTH
jgi:hypothetical protein